MARFVRNPLLVNFLVDAGQDAEEIGTSSVSVNISAHSVHNIDRVVGLELPGARLEGVRQVVESANWAKVYDVSRELVCDDLLNVGANFVGFAAHDLAKSVLSSDQLSEPDASGAVNAASHSRLDQRAELLVLDSALVLLETAIRVAVDLRNVLQVTFASLIANWAVERMVSQEELHDATIIIKLQRKLDISI